MEENTYITDHYGERKEFTITELEEKAGKGDVESQMILGDLFYDYIDGDVSGYNSSVLYISYPSLDINKAIFWYSKAAALGSDVACQKLAVCQEEVATLQDALEKAERHLDAETALFLGQCYAYGHCAPVDDAEALKWLQKAVRLRCFDALTLLAYNLGFFNQTDEDKKACVDLFFENLRVKKHTLDSDGSNSDDTGKFYALAYSVYGNEYVDGVLAELANNDDIDALCRLGCYRVERYDDFEEYMEENSVTTMDILRQCLWCGMHDFKYFSYLPKYFRHGIIVDKDLKITEILERCITNIKEVYTDPDFYDLEEETEELCCSYCNDDDRRYIFGWLKKTAESDSPLKEIALAYLEEFNQYGHSASTSPLEEYPF